MLYCIALHCVALCLRRVTSYCIVLYCKVMLDDEPEKLMVMKDHLTQGEEAMLNGAYGVIHVLRNVFFWKFYTHPPPRNANMNYSPS